MSAPRRPLALALAGAQLAADRLPVSRPAVSKHLRLLQGAGLVAHRSEGGVEAARGGLRGDDGIEGQE